MLEKQTAIGIDSSLFGLCSFRLGDASAAANSGMPDRLFERQSRWSSENAKDGYVKDSLAQRLQVSSGLGL